LAKREAASPVGDREPKHPEKVIQVRAPTTGGDGLLTLAIGSLRRVFHRAPYGPGTEEGVEPTVGPPDHGPRTREGEDHIIELADYQSFLTELALRRNQGITVVQELLHAFCAQCGLEFTQDALPHLYLMGPKSSYRRRLGSAGAITNATSAGDALRAGKCPACASPKMRVAV
jgi:hypothetical protein